jgi:hypothetical protein
MCYFITLGVPENEEVIFKKELTNKIEFDRNNNNYIKDIFPANYKLFNIIQGGCSCDLYENVQYEEKINHLVDKYKKKKWSDGKINRAIEDYKKSNSEKSNDTAKKLFNYIKNRNNNKYFLLRLLIKIVG